MNNKVKKRILVFGGSFDPVHITHMNLVKAAIDQFKIDRVFIVPSSIALDPKKKIVVSAFHRLKMLRLAIKEANVKNVYLSTHECYRKYPNYTIDTINFFKAKFATANFFLLIGADQVINFPQWKQAEEISQKVVIIYAPRTGYALSNYDEVIKKYQMNKLNVPTKRTSSSNFRLAVDIKNVPSLVIRYINENGLYATSLLQGLSQNRLLHCFRVAQMAKKIALGNNLKMLAKKAYVAGLFHDFAKEFPKQKMMAIAKENNINSCSCFKTLHGPVASFVLREKFAFCDEEVLSSIFYHTEPFLNHHHPSLLDKIIYVADKIEINRKQHFENASYYYKIRKLCLKDVNRGFSELYNISLKYLIKKERVPLK